MITDTPRDGEKIVKDGIATRLFFSFIDQVTRVINDNQTSTADLENISSSVNTSPSKVLGFSLLNETTGVTVFASGNTDGAVWQYFNETTAHTPV